MAKIKFESDADREVNYRMHRNELIARVGGLAIRWAVLAWMAYYGYKSVDALAGRTTLADIIIKVFGGFKINTAAAWALGFGGIGYGRREHRLRVRVNEALGNRVKQLEQKIDRRRTSSQLTKRGQTRPQDSL